MNEEEVDMLPTEAPMLCIKAAMELIGQKFREEDDYFWAWWCNIVMPIIDSGAERTIAEKAAALIFSILFGYNVRDSEMWRQHASSNQ